MIHTADYNGLLCYTRQSNADAVSSGCTNCGFGYYIEALTVLLLGIVKFSENS